MTGRNNFEGKKTVSMYTYNELITEIKKVVSNQTFPPKYNPKEWEGKSSNCYLYALGVCMDINLEEYWVVPGIISRGINNIWNIHRTIKLFKEDCKALDLRVVESSFNDELYEGEYKIAIYLYPKHNNFHFIRQDADGTWSEKRGWFGNVQKVEKILRHDNIYVFKISKK